MRPPAEQLCDRRDPRIKCIGRYDATLRGDFLYSFRAGGWVWSAFGGLEGGVAFKKCPWCKGKLPDLAAVYRRLRAGIEEED